MEERNEIFTYRHKFFEHGFVSYNEEGNIDDSCDEDTRYETGEVINQLEKIVSNFEEFVEKEKEMKERLIETFELD